LNKAVKIEQDAMSKDVVFGNTFKVYFIIADSYFGLKEYDNVIKQFKLLGEDESINFDDYVFWLRAMAYQLNNIEQYKYAISLYDLPFIKQQNNPEVYCDKADSYFGLKQYDNIIKQFQLAANCVSLNINRYLYSLKNMSTKLIEIKQYQYAIKLYDLALLKQPNNSEIRNAKDSAERAKGLKQNTY
jgi:tetratricopeptide (TPR) repeat protein